MRERDVEPVLRPREAAQKSYDRLSRWYDLIAASEEPFVDEGLAMLDSRDGETVLEIGFGTGRALVDLARGVGESGSVCGIDLSRRMVERSRRRVADAGHGDRVALTQGDAVRLPYANRAFDAVFTSFTLELFSAQDLMAVLEECLRVLRPDGRVAAVSLSKEGGPYPMRRLYEVTRRLAPRLLDCRPIYTARSLEQSGFDLTTVRTRRMWGMPVELVLAAPPELTDGNAGPPTRPGHVARE